MDHARRRRGARRRRCDGRTTPLAVGAAVLVGVVVAVGLVAAGPEESSRDTAPPARVYELRVRGSSGEALIVSPGRSGPARREHPDTSLPWTARVAVPAGRPAPSMAVSALSRDPRVGWITCAIVRDGVIVDERTGTGPRPFANCYGR